MGAFVVGILGFIVVWNQETLNTLGHSIFGHVHYPTYNSNAFRFLVSGDELKAYDERLFNANQIGTISELQKVIEEDDF